MNKTIGWIVLVLAVVGLVWWGSSKKAEVPAGGEAIKIGLLMPMTGELGAFGTNVKKGVEIALAQQSGVRTEVIVEDTGVFTTSAALTGFKKLTEVDDVDVVIGPFGPAQTLTIGTATKPDRPVVIAVSNCDERFKELGAIFCIYPGIKDQVLGGIDFMKSKNWKNAYLLTENTEFGLEIEGLLKENKEQINLVGVEKVTPNQTKDLRTVIAKALSAKPDVVYAMFAPNEGLIVLRQFPQLSQGKNIPLYIGTDVNKDQLVDLFGQNAPGIYFSSRMDEDYNQDFINRFKSETGGNPDYFAALGHSSAVVLLDALKQSKDNLSLLPASMIGVVDPTTAVRDFQFKSDKTVSVPLYDYEFKNGQFVKP